MCGFERGDEHEGILQELGDALAPRLDARGAMIAEAPGPVGEQPHALQEIVDDERLEHVHARNFPKRRRY